MPSDPGTAAPPDVLRVVTEPNRWRVLAELARSDRQVSELTTALHVPQSLVSYHLRELQAAGLVTAKRSAADGRDTFYRLEAGQWLSLLSEAAGALQPGVTLETAPPPPPRPVRGRPPRVLFLCTGNSARSQMAEALLRHRTGAGTVDARSAGSHPKAVHPTAVAVMAERGIDLSGHEAKPLTRFRRLRFDHVITLCDKVREICPEFPGQPATAHWSVADPALEGDSPAGYAAFQRTADELDGRITCLIARLSQPH
ncbi:MAG: MarR family transcriptional regulator [Acidimicrobiales bacterium]